MIRSILGIRFQDKWEKLLTNYGWLLFRVGISLLMMFHGYSKLANFSHIAPKFLNFLGLGTSISLGLVVLSEFFGSICVLLGFLTRWAAFSIVFTMLVAIFVAHGMDPFAKKELAVLYAVVFIFPLFAGGGKYSIDNYLSKKLPH